MFSVEKEELKEHILTHGCCPAEENLNIYEKYLAHAPRYLFRAVDKKYHIAQKILCDVGCGMVFWGSGACLISPPLFEKTIYITQARQFANTLCADNPSFALVTAHSR